MTRAPFRAGFRDVSPILLGVIPFGLVTGFSGIDAGLSFIQTLGTSTVIFAGASQLAVIDLLGRDAPAFVAILTALVINARMMMYSAALAPWFAPAPLRDRAAMAYLLTDQAFAVSIVHYERHDDSIATRSRYYLGAALGLWTTWHISTIVGALIGTGLPEGLGLDFAIPLVFLALLVPAVRDRATLVAATVAGVVVLVAYSLPFNSALLVASAAGIVAGLLVPVPEDFRGDTP
ncbi:MAG: AzlC family ABC transporter permease [Acidimicrobiia bacterium]|nr:AzlC family ABC transporter permease [Acidimicrobiia bacterium]